VSAARCSSCKGLLPAWLTAAGGATSAKCPNCGHVNELVATGTPPPQALPKTTDLQSTLQGVGAGKSANLNKTMFMGSGTAKAPDLNGQKAAGLAKTMMMPQAARSTPPPAERPHKRVPTLPQLGGTELLPSTPAPVTPAPMTPPPVVVPAPPPAVVASPPPTVVSPAAAAVDDGETDADIDVEIDTPPPAPPAQSSVPSWVISEPMDEQQSGPVMARNPMTLLRSRPAMIGAGVVGLVLVVVLLTRGHKPRDPVSVEVKRPPVAHEKFTPPPEPVAEPAPPAELPAPRPIARKAAEHPRPVAAEPPHPHPVAATSPPVAEPAAERKVMVASAKHVAAATPPDHPRRSGLPSEDDQRLAREAYARGNTQLYQGHADEAISAFKDSLRLDPRNPAVQRGLGLAYGQSGNAAQAVSYLKRYLKASPGASDRALIEKRIEQLSAR
jgi:phage FluMu protein Com